jgi:hypothetical protein
MLFDMWGHRIAGIRVGRYVVWKLTLEKERFPAVSVPLHDRLEGCTFNHHMQLRSREDRRHE